MWYEETFGLEKLSVASALRAPTVDVGYVPNAKYLAHIPHQTQFMPNYQMWYMLNFFQLATVKSQIYQCTDRCGILVYYFLFLSQPSFPFISPSAHRLHLHLPSSILFLLPSSPLLHLLQLTISFVSTITNLTITDLTT